MVGGGRCHVEKINVAGTIYGYIIVHVILRVGA